MDDFKDDRDFFELIEPALGQVEIALRPERARRDPGEPKRAARYLRLSVPDEDDDSIGLQNERTGDYIDALGADCIIPDHIFIDRDRTATTIRGRFGLIALLEAIVAGEIDIVVVLNISRLTRSLRDAAWLEEFLRKHRVELHIVGQGKVEGFALLLGGYEAQTDRQRFRDRSRDGRKEAARRGRFMGKYPQYGYDQLEDRSSWKINDGQANVLKRIARDLDAGMTEYALSKALNLEGIPAPGGGLWNPKVFFRIRWALLKRTLLKGVYAYGTGEDRIEFDVPHLLIIEVEVFDRLYKKFVTDREKRVGSKDADGKAGAIEPNSRSVVGKLQCSCGAPIYVKKDWPPASLICESVKLGGTCCSSWQPPSAEVVRSILLILRDEILCPGRSAEWDRLLRRDRKLRDAASEPRRKEIRTALQTIDRMIDCGPSFADDDLAPGFNAVRRWRELQKVNLLEELQQLNLPKPNALVDPAELDGLRAACARMMTRLPDLQFREVDPAVLRRLREIVPRVVVKTDTAGERYELRLLLGQVQATSKPDVPEERSPRWIVRSFPRPGTGPLRFPEAVLANHRRAENGEFMLSEDDWSLIRHLYGKPFRLGLDPRLAAEAVMFLRLTRLMPDFMPERYFEVADVTRRTADRTWPKVQRILRSRGSDHVRQLMASFDRFRGRRKYAGAAS